MGKTLCITNFEDAVVGPRQSSKVKSFLEAMAGAIKQLVLNDNQSVLVFCHQGQNRSAAVCCLALKSMKQCSSFDESTIYLIKQSEIASNEGKPVPNKFLCSHGGEHFALLLEEHNNDRPRRRVVRRNGDALASRTFLSPNEPYTLKLFSGKGGGSLWIGNLAGWRKAVNISANDGGFSIMINLCGKDQELADRRSGWKNCTEANEIIRLLQQY